MHDNLINLQVDEYLLEELLGRGGMARVYRALDVNLNRYAAIKVIDPPHQSEEDYAVRFRREARAIAQLDHPHVIRLYRYGEFNGLLYMAMQYVQGADLKFVLESYRRDREYLEMDEIARLIREICEALDYVHSQGIIHRDVKPSNILLDSRGRVILSDFGLVMSSANSTLGETFGSPSYIAPEQAISSAKALPQSDLYSVGVMLFEMLTNQVPFSAPEPLTLALMHVNNPPPSPSLLRPGIIPDLEAVVLKALAKKPEDRFHDGQSLVNALDAALQNQPRLTEIPGTTVPERVTQSIAVHPLPPIPSSARPPRTVAAATVVSAPAAATEMGAPQDTVTSVYPELPTLPGQAPALQPETISSPVGDAPTRRPRWMAGAAVVVLLLAIVACLSLASALVNASKNSLASSAATGTAPASQGNSGAAGPRPTSLSAATLTPALPSGISTPANQVVAPFEVQINRQGKDKGYLVIINTGKVAFPLNSLKLSADKTSISGNAWQTQQLEPGECVLAMKIDGKNSVKMPAGITCTPAAPAIALAKKEEGLYTEKLAIYFDDQLVSDCAKDERLCSFAFTTP